MLYPVRMPLKQLFTKLSFLRLNIVPDRFRRDFNDSARYEHVEGDSDCIMEGVRDDCYAQVKRRKV